jgi:hypothetical protein
VWREFLARDFRRGRLRRQQFWLRFAWTAACAGQLIVVFLQADFFRWRWHDPFAFPRYMQPFALLLTIETIVVLGLLAPALAAITVAEDKRDILPDLHTTPMAPFDYILAKWLGVLLRLVDLLATGLPALAIAAGLAGISAVDVLGLVLLPLPWLPALAALGLLLGLEATAKFAALAPGVAMAALLLVSGWTGPVEPADLAQQLGHGTAPEGWIWSTALAATIILLGLAVVRVRPVLRSALQPQAARRAQTIPERPAVDDRPVVWLESQVYATRLPGWLQSLIVVAMAVWLSTSVVGLQLHARREDGSLAGWLQGVATPQPLFLYTIMILVTALVIVSVRAAFSVARERQAQTWEPLLLTPLETLEILEQKRDGIARSALLGFWLAMAMVLPLAVAGGSETVLIVGLGAIIGTLLVRVFAGEGVAQSVLSRSPTLACVITITTVPMRQLMFLVTSVVAGCVGSLVSCAVGPLGLLMLMVTPIMWVMLADHGVRDSLRRGVYRIEANERGARQPHSP